MSDLELQQLFDNTFDCYTYYEDDSMEEVQEPAMTKVTFVAEVFKLLRKQANDSRTENGKCDIPDVSFSEAELNAKLDEQKESIRQWLEGEGYELLAERI